MYSYQYFFSVFLLLLFLTFPMHPKAQDLRYWGIQQQKADDLYKQGNYANALKTYIRVAEATASTYSQVKIAWIYHNGLGVKRSCKEAVRWYTHAANSKDQTAQNNLYVLYTNGCPDLSKNELLGVKYLKMSAESGNSRAQTNLASLYAVGDKVQKNPYQAYDLAQRSAKQNDIAGILQLSKYYTEGIGVPKNLNKAYSLLSNAARMEVKEWDKINKQEAQLLLGGVLFEGRGVPKDINEAYQWFLLASGGQNQEISKTANQYLDKSREYLSKEEIELSTKKASSVTKTQTLASDEDLVTALYQAIHNDRKESAIRLAKTLSNQGNSTGELILGLMHRDGYSNIPQDIDEGYVLFKRSCKSGEWEACAYQVDSLIKLKRIDAANQLLNNISSKVPKEDKMQIMLAQLYFDLNSKVKSESIVRRVLINDPINEPAKFLLSEINKVKK